MRYCETRPLYAAVLVSAYISDLGDRTEAKSGYFNRPWKWDQMKQNCSRFIQFASSDDPFLPMEEQMTVARETEAVLHSSDSEGHYMKSKFTQLFDVIKGLIDSYSRKSNTT